MAHLTRDQLKEQLSSIGETKKGFHVADLVDSFRNLIDDGPAPLIYAAGLNQSGANDIVVIDELSNIGSIAWSRIDSTKHDGTLTGAFPADKTHVIIGNGSDSEKEISAARVDDNTIRITCTNDGDIQQAFIFIRRMR